MAVKRGQLIFFFGPAGSGKSTLAKAWCGTRERAAHIELDEIRSFIVSGLADPQSDSPLVSAQYETSVDACCAIARSFVSDGYDTAIDDAAAPTDFTRYWEPNLAGLNWQIVVIRPDLETAFRRNEERAKSVKRDIIRRQHSASGDWPTDVTVDTTGISVGVSLERVLQVLESGDLL